MTQTIENKGTCTDPKTSLKDFKNDDEPAALYVSDNKIDFRPSESSAHMSFETNSLVSLSDAMVGEVESAINDVSKKLIGKELKPEDQKKFKELTELLVMELEIAAARADSISNVPAFLTEHLRRRLSGKSNIRTSNKTPTAKLADKDSQTGKKTDAVQNNAEIYQAEPLTAQARETVLKTMREYVEKDQKDFVWSLRNTYTAEDWKWLSKNLPDEGT